MKRFVATILILAMALLSAGACAAEGNAVVPYPVDTEVNTIWGVYYAEAADVSTFANGGYIDVTLYEQDVYMRDDIEGLKPGSRVMIEGTEYKAASVTPKGNGTIEIVPEGSRLTYTFLPFNENYIAADSSGQGVATRIGNYRITTPLKETFKFCYIDSDDSIKAYDADAFAEIMAGNVGSFERTHTVIAFGNKAPYRIILGTKTITDSYGAVEAANDAIKKGKTTGGTSSIKPGSISSIAKPGSSSAVPAEKGSGTSAGGSTGAAGVSSFQLTPLVWNGAGLGKCAVPEGYTMASQVYCNDENTCLGAPLRISVVETSASVPAILGFYSSEYFVERVKSGYFPHRDGARDGQLDTFMLRYRDAAGFCDLVASNLAPGAAYYKDEDMSFYNSMIEAHRRQYESEAEPGLKKQGIKLNWVEITGAHRTYTYKDDNGITCALCVMAEVRALQTNAAGDVATFWEVPAYYYMTCPLAVYDQVHSTDFQAFIENTAVSDTFIQLQEQLTTQIKNEIEEGWNAAIRASNAYTSAMNALMEQSVNNYLYSSSYSSSDRFSDYIFDRYEYNTSDGYSVSISTQYDYVWESNGAVYFSDSSFDVPSGATLLSPVR